MSSAADELKAQYASNRKQISRDYRKIEDLERGIKHSNKISERESLNNQITALVNGISDMNKQNQQAMERIRQWWTE